jgi:hypothetical protein
MKKLRQQREAVEFGDAATATFKRLKASAVRVRAMRLMRIILTPEADPEEMVTVYVDARPHPAFRAFFLAHLAAGIGNPQDAYLQWSAYSQPDAVWLSLYIESRSPHLVTTILFPFTTANAPLWQTVEEQRRRPKGGRRKAEGGRFSIWDSG